MDAESDSFVFLHVPKTAGTSVRALVAGCFPDGQVSPAFAVREFTPTFAAELAAHRVVSGHLSWEDVREHFPRRRAFTFLRDPVDRCLSVYGFFRGHTAWPLVPLHQITNSPCPVEACSLARQLDPADFFRSAHPQVRQNVDNRMVWQLGHHAGVSRRGRTTAAEAFRRAVDTVERLPFVGFCERLNRDVPRLLNFLGAPPDRPLPELNRTARRTTVADLGSDARRVLAKLTDLDRRLYDAAAGAWERR